jgi:hypothetical protein
VSVVWASHAGHYRRTRGESCPQTSKTALWEVNGPDEALHLIHFQPVRIHMTVRLAGKKAVSGDCDKSYVYDFR